MGPNSAFVTTVLGCYMAYIPFKWRVRRESPQGLVLQAHLVLILLSSNGCKIQLNLPKSEGEPCSCSVGV